MRVEQRTVYVATGRYRQRSTHLTARAALNTEAKAAVFHHLFGRTRSGARDWDDAHQPLGEVAEEALKERMRQLYQRAKRLRVHLWNAARRA
jgi:hypothetical protein